MSSGGTEPGKNLNKLTGRLARGDGFTVVRLEGVIDEHNDLARYSGAIGSGEVLLLDLGGVKRLNSVGVRDWVNWLRELRGKFRDVLLYDCTPAVMNEVNFVKNFAEGARIVSFAVPLYCGECGKEESRLIETSSLANTRRLPAFGCGKEVCQNVLDDDEESYLGFLDAARPDSNPARTAELIAAARLAVVTAEPIRPESGQVSAARSQPLGQIGHRVDQVVAPVPVAPPPAAVPMRAEATKSDWLFTAAMAAMVAVLGVLVYLILTLE